MKKRPAFRYSDSAESVIERTSFSNMAEPFGLASSSRAIREPSAPRMPFALTSKPTGIEPTLVAWSLPLNFVPAVVVTFWPSTIRLSPCRHSR